MDPRDPRLLVDENLIGLARHLRLFGFDVATPVAGTSDAVVGESSRREGRTLVTRDRELAARGAPALRVTEEDLGAQVRQVLAVTGVPPSGRWFTRCSRCNLHLGALGPDDPRRADVPPPYRSGAAWTCPGCRRVYWPGGHFARAMAELKTWAASVGASPSSHRPGDERRPGTRGR